MCFVILTCSCIYLIFWGGGVETWLAVRYVGSGAERGIVKYFAGFCITLLLLNKASDNSNLCCSENVY